LWKVDYSKSLKEFEQFEKAAASCPYFVAKVKILRANTYSFHDKVFEMFMELQSIDQFLRNNEHTLPFEEMSFFLNYTWGRYHVILGEFRSAEKDYQKAIENLDELQRKGNNVIEPYRSTTLRQQGSLLGKMNRDQEAISILEQALAIEKHLGKKALNKKHIGNSYVRLGNFELANQYFDEAKADLDKLLPNGFKSSASKKHKNKMISLLNDYANLNMEIARKSKDTKYFDLAGSYYMKSLKWHNDTIQDPRLQFLYYRYATFLLETDQLTTSQYYYQKAKKISSSKFEKSKNLIQLSQIYQKQNKLQKALDSIAVAINYLGHGLPKKSNDLSLGNAIPNPLLIGALTLKATYFFDQYTSTSDQNKLSSAWKTVQRAAAIIDQILPFYNSFGDKENLVAKSYSLFEMAISIGKELYKQTGKQEYVDQAFLFAEQSKAIVLKDAFKHTYAQQFGIPKGLRQKDLAYRQSLFKFDNKLQKLRHKNETSGEKYNSTLNKYLAARKKYESFNEDSLSAFPKYKALVNQSTDRPKLLKKLKENLKRDQTILEYFIGSNIAFAFVLMADQPIKVIELDVEIARLENVIQDFRNCSKTYNDDSCLRKWPEKSYDLYQLIIEPLKDKLTKRVTIIPDGFLCYIPFSTLISNYEKVGAKQKIAYATLPYLLHHYVFNYNYSAFTAFDDLPHGNDKSLFSFSGYAPSFYENKQIAAQSLSSQDGVYGAISGSADLIKEISEYYPPSKSKLFKDEQGTKYNFLKYAPNSKVIHLHTHGEFDENEIEQSYIAFHQKENSPDSNLYIRELYGIQLNSDLITTAVCYSGDGQLRKGQGIISLARGFFYAGVKSIFPALWEGNNNSLSEITSLFYQYVDEGMEVSAAMNQAKKDYLKAHEKEEFAYPYYWGAYIGISKHSVGTKDSWFGKYKFFGGVGVLGLLVLLFFYKFSNNKAASS